MITGPITENENNPNKIWGSWIYKGEFVNIEIKTPISTKEHLLLHLNNIAYGYKEIYETQVGRFGQSASCEINVVCSLGTGWEKEKYSSIRNKWRWYWFVQWFADNECLWH
ncbi:MAG: hypothetical protein WKG06_19295 [Segetibacter sp.]